MVFNCQRQTVEKSNKIIIKLMSCHYLMVKIKILTKKYLGTFINQTFV